MNYQLSVTKYSHVYGCGRRTIERAKGNAEPLDDPREMFARWSAQKSAPAGATAKGLALVLTDYALACAETGLELPPAVPPVSATPAGAALAVDLPRGAQHALRRLEEMEVEARVALSAIDEIADPLRHKAATDRYLKISESLRKFDLLVEQDRRDAGELIPRADAELAIEMAATWLRLAVQTFVGSYTERLSRERDLSKIATLIRTGMGAAVETNLLRAPKCRTPLPPWGIAAVRRGYDVPEGVESQA